jgi:hypothetical protein
MKLPRFLLGDNTDCPDDIFIVHLEFPRCVINLKDDDIEMIDEVTDLSDLEFQEEITELVVDATKFYDREMERYEKQ